jgi:guanosine-3',5'-bis(diphosphate) 3'-pyrophosphohydrolase
MYIINPDIAARFKNNSTQAAHSLSAAGLNTALSGVQRAGNLILTTFLRIYGTSIMNEERPGDVLASLFSALKFAAQKHRQQRRKDPDATPYINHPIAVAELLVRIGGVRDRATLLAALLHDTLEDTQTTPEELQQHFGQQVLFLVQEVTDQKDLPQAQRKQLQIEHAPHMSKSAQQIKVADKTCNLIDILGQQPMGWSLARKHEYLDWAEKVVAGCRGCNEGLERHFEAVLKEKRLMLKSRV